MADYDELFFIKEKELKDIIQRCQKAEHVQQVAYSTYHDCLTQICFSCRVVRTSMDPSDINSNVARTPLITIKKE